MLTTAEAAALLSERGIRVRGNKPGARTVESWCKRGLIKADRIGGPRRGIYLIEEKALEGFEPPILGRRKHADIADEQPKSEN